MRSESVHTQMHHEDTSRCVVTESVQHWFPTADGRNVKSWWGHSLDSRVLSRLRRGQVLATLDQSSSKRHSGPLMWLLLQCASVRVTHRICDARRVDKQRQKATRPVGATFSTWIHWHAPTSKAQLTGGRRKRYKACWTIMQSQNVGSS